MPNELAMKYHLLYERQILMLYRTNPTKMNFYNPDCKIDFKRAGSWVASAPPSLK